MSLTKRVLKTVRFHMLTKRMPALHTARKREGSCTKQRRLWLFIQKMMRILRKKVTMLTTALILYWRERVEVRVTMCRIRVLFVTAFSSVTRVSTANPIAGQDGSE